MILQIYKTRILKNKNIIVEIKNTNGLIKWKSRHIKKINELFSAVLILDPLSQPVGLWECHQWDPAS